MSTQHLKKGLRRLFLILSVIIFLFGLTAREPEFLFCLSVGLIILATTIGWILLGFGYSTEVKSGDCRKPKYTLRDKTLILLTLKAIQEAIDNYGFMVVIDNMKATLGWNEIHDQEKEAIAKCWRLLAILMVPERIDSAVADSELASEFKRFWVDINGVNRKEYIELVAVLQEKLNKLGNILMLFPFLVSDEGEGLEDVERLKCVFLNPQMAQISSKLVMFIQDFVPRILTDNPFDIVPMIDSVASATSRNEEK